MAKSIQTTGDLREFLINVALGLKSGDVKPDEAARITKLAAQVHESFYSEAKIAKLRAELGEPVAALGSLPINK